MKALTLTQPWATLMALGQKRIETRSWPAGYRGELVIHAAKGFPKWAKEACDEEPFRSALGQWTAKTLPLSEGLCVVRLIGCYRTDEMHKLAFQMGYKPNARELAFGDYSEGRYAWLTEYVRALPYTGPRRGALGLWEWNPQQAAEDALMRGEGLL
jgi:hypothetical protein